MTSTVAIVRFEKDVHQALAEALELLGGIKDLNTEERDIVIKVGVFSASAEFHSSVNVVGAIADCFSKARKIFITESDNYRGTGTERLQIWKELFNKRITPFNLSEDKETRKTKVADEDLDLSHVLFKPNAFVSTHIWREYERGSILKNLLGLVPDAKKARFHKKLAPALADMYEATGGIDLAVLDGTFIWKGIGQNPARMNTLFVGRDAVAVEALGASLTGLDPKKMPVVKEFARRGLGESDLNRIQTVGFPLDRLKEEIKKAPRTKRKQRQQGPQTWGGHAYNAFASLMREGFFSLPNKRSISEIVEALKSKSLPTEGKQEKIVTALARRVKNGTLKVEGRRNKKVYWRE